MCIARLRRQTRDKYWKKPLKPVRCKKNIVPLQRARASRRDSTQKRRGRCPATAGMDRAEAGRRVQSAGCPDHASRAGRSRPDLLQLPHRSQCKTKSDHSAKRERLAFFCFCTVKKLAENSHFDHSAKPFADTSALLRNRRRMQVGESRKSG